MVAGHPSSARIDLAAAAAELGVDLEPACVRLGELYRWIDERIAATTAGLELPCGVGCADCCHDSVVLLSPLEFFYAWDWAQRTLDDLTRAALVDRGRAEYLRLRPQIESLHDAAIAPAVRRRTALGLRFTCPMLDAGGRCLIYPVRSLQSRLFGQSFNDQSGIYGCARVGRLLANRTVTLVQASAALHQLQQLPLTFLQQVYPFYLNLFYGAGGTPPRST
ncbi:MAG: hypothetical protein JXR83_13880 [Deltaproteobacteria bacterium]|nr:hypothetical protein [Deltaproteobacteria bacterium]